VIPLTPRPVFSLAAIAPRSTHFLAALIMGFGLAPWSSPIVQAQSLMGRSRQIQPAQPQPAQIQPAQIQPTQTALLRPGSWQEASFPVEQFQTYTSPFGYRRLASGSDPEFHSGLDMAAPEGSYIRSWWLGTVKAVSDQGRCGTSITIQSGNWEHIYCHMSGRVAIVNGQRTLVDREGGLQLQEGQLIPTGSRIGRVGMTGRTSGPHLHWGLKFNGQWVDPSRVLQAMYDGLAQSSGGQTGTEGRSRS
jgi:murein DD-endopeptidase MepM/ murein hydrolase activator NlpD